MYYHFFFRNAKTYNAIDERINIEENWKKVENNTQKGKETVRKEERKRGKLNKRHIESKRIRMKHSTTKFMSLCESMAPQAQRKVRNSQ